MRVYNGSAWVNAAFDVSGALINTNNLSDVSNAATALTNLGVTSTAAELNKLDALSRGSLIYGNASAATAVLTKGGAGTVLSSDGTDISWAAASGGADPVVFPSNWASPTNNYTSSGTWDKGSLADDDFVWFYGIDGGDGGGAYFAVNLGGAAFAGHAGKASLFYGKASIFHGASYVVGAGGAGRTSNSHSSGGASTLTLSSGLVLSNSSDDNVPDYVMGSSGAGTYISSTFSPDVNFTLNLPITVSSVAYAQSGLNQQTLNNTLFGGHGAFGSNNTTSPATNLSLFGGANGASLGAAGSAPGGAGAGNTSGTGGAGATGSWRVYHV